MGGLDVNLDRTKRFTHLSGWKRQESPSQSASCIPSWIPTYLSGRRWPLLDWRLYAMGLFELIWIWPSWFCRTLLSAVCNFCKGSTWISALSWYLSNLPLIIRACIPYLLIEVRVIHNIFRSVKPGFWNKYSKYNMIILRTTYSVDSLCFEK